MQTECSMHHTVGGEALTTGCTTMLELQDATFIIQLQNTQHNRYY